MATEPSLDLTWTVEESSDRELTLKLKFAHPELVSPENQADLTLLKISFLDPNAFVEKERFVSLVSKDFTLTTVLWPISQHTPVKEVPWSSSASWPITMLVLTFIVFNVLGFYAYENH